MNFYILGGVLSTFRASLAVDTWLLSAKILTSRVIGVEIHPFLASITGDIALIGVEIHPLFQVYNRPMQVHFL